MKEESLTINGCETSYGQISVWTEGQKEDLRLEIN